MASNVITLREAHAFDFEAVSPEESDALARVVALADRKGFRHTEASMKATVFVAWQWGVPLLEACHRVTLALETRPDVH